MKLWKNLYNIHMFFLENNDNYNNNEKKNLTYNCTTSNNITQKFNI